MNDTDATQRFLDSLPELTPDQEFQFACHPGVPCFNACCGDLTLMLTPYDVLRLRRKLGVSSGDFLRYSAETAMAPDTGLPSVRLKMRDDKRRSCPFVTPEGCTVYPDRPGACRTYPLGRATRVDDEGAVHERFFLVREPHCKGFAEPTTFTPRTWLTDQELDLYNAKNDAYMRFMARIKSTGKAINPKHTNMAALALYQLDDFARFIESTGVLDRLDLDQATRAAILAYEEARLDFALDWLEMVIFGHSDNLRVKA